MVIEKHSLFLDSSWAPGDSARMKYCPKPVPETGLIRALSPGVQLKSKNKGYFSIVVSHVDSEKNTRNVDFYFWGRFWYPPHPGMARISDAGKNLHFAYFFGIFTKNGYKNVSFIFGSELVALRYGRSPFMKR